MAKYQIVVGNLGTVYDGDDFKAAHEHFRDYVNLSKQEGYRVSGESVTFFRDGELVEERRGTADKDE